MIILFSSLKNVKFEQLNIPLSHHGKLIEVKGAQVDSIRSKLHCLKSNNEVINTKISYQI